MLLRVGINRTFSTTGPAKRALLLGLGGGDSLGGTMTKKKVDLGGGLTKEKVLAMLKQQNEELEQKGVSPTMLLVDPTCDKLNETVSEALRGKEYDVISIGAGVRTLPEHFFLFENLVNLVHEHAPNSRIAFDTGPGDKVESILRNLK